MNIVLIYLVICFLVIEFVFIIPNKIIKQKQEKLKKENVLCEFNLRHIAGHPNIKPNEPIKFNIKNNKIYLIKFFKDFFEYNLTDITRLEIKNEEQITKDVTLGRLLLLGPLAFGLKKTTKHETQYLILSYIENGITIDCIFKNEVRDQNLNEIPGILNKMKLKQINNEQIPKTSVTI